MLGENSLIYLIVRGTPRNSEYNHCKYGGYGLRNVVLSRGTPRRQQETQKKHNNQQTKKNPFLTISRFRLGLSNGLIARCVQCVLPTHVAGNGDTSKQDAQQQWLTYER